MSQGGHANPYSGQASLGAAAGHHGELLTGGSEEPAGRKTELERMQAAAKQAERQEARATGGQAEAEAEPQPGGEAEPQPGGEAEPQPGGEAAQLKAGAEYLEKELKDIEERSK